MAELLSLCLGLRQHEGGVASRLKLFEHSTNHRIRQASTRRRLPLGGRWEGCLQRAAEQPAGSALLYRLRQHADGRGSMRCEGAGIDAWRAGGERAGGDQCGAIGEDWGIPDLGEGGRRIEMSCRCNWAAAAIYC